MDQRVRLLRITTVPISLKLLLAGQLNYFRNKKFDVLAVSAEGAEIVHEKIDGVPHQVIPFTRKITPLQDLACLLQLIIVINNFKPDIIHTHTPKAGILGMLAGWMCRVPVRMHTVAGLPLMEKKGFTRKLLVFVEKLTYWCSTHVFPNSTGLKKFIESEISSSFKLKVIGKGSSNGIDTYFFQRRENVEREALAIRRQHGIGPDDLVFSFVGRVVRDKGIGELVEAFQRTRERLGSTRKIFLLVVGPLEQELDPLKPDDLHFLTEDDRVVLAGYQVDVRPWIAASDVFVFPSYREGFPNVVMQACCLEVPCIVSDINGCNEIISHNQTGFIVKPKNAIELQAAMVALAQDDEKRKRMAKAGREYVCANFDHRFVWDEINREYEKALFYANSEREVRFNAYRRIVKPAFDFLVATIALIVASPVFLICIILLAIANKGSIWFTQRRPGKKGKLFTVVKFKTMNDARDADGNLLPDHVRLTAVGSFIRKTSLDEIPQLINILKGDMSFIGPRPLLEEYLPLYNDDQRQRHDVTPGITGWAQVNGRNAISWPEKFAYDVWYVKHQSFLLDIKILFLTVAKVFKAEGISSDNHVTMERWRGNSNVVSDEATVSASSTEHP
jgi:lipopolysaccharide/colanic/teichoic acid biosynthesis glycosyltransferase